MSYNKAIFLGRICNDLEIKTTPTGTSVLSFRLAVDRSYQAKGEERKSDFFNIVAWRNTAEFIHRYFTKGKMILVEGELQTRQYKNKEGVETTVTELIVDSANFTGEKTNGNGATSNATQQTATYTTAPQNVAQGANSVANTSGSDYVDDDVSDYPF